MDSTKPIPSTSYENASSKAFEELEFRNQFEPSLKVQRTFGSTGCHQEATFSKRHGTGNIKGQLYSIELSMLFLLQGQTEKATGRIDGFHLASNMAEVDFFRDVVFKYRCLDLSAQDENKQEMSKIIFLHSIHVDDPKTKKITVDIFPPESENTKEKHLVISLQEHFSAYRAIKQKFSEQGEHPIFGTNFEDSEFLIYTNGLPAFGENKDIVQKIDSHNENNLHFHVTQVRDSYYKLIFTGDTGNTKDDTKSRTTTAQSRIISTLQNSSECSKLAKELAKAVFLNKGGKSAEIVHQSILKKYHIPLSQTVITKNNKPKSKRGEFSIKFIDGGKNLSQEDNDFRKEFFEEAVRITQKTESELKKELRGKVIVLAEKFGNPAGTEEDSIRSLPNDRVSEREISEFFSKLKLYTGQPGEEDLAEIIKEKIKSAYSVEKDDLNAIFSDVKVKLQRWWKDETKTYLTEKNRFFQDSVRISISFDIEKPIEMFTGRKQELSCLCSMLQPQADKEGDKTQMAVIAGLGGIGKTELARQYIYKHSQDFDNNVVWINAKSYGTLSDSFLRLAQSKLDVRTEDLTGKRKDIKSIVEEVYEYFSKRKCLFVFDDAERYKTHEDYDSGIDKFLPHFAQHNKAYVLVTSANEEWGNVKTLPLDNLKEEEATVFIRNALKIQRGFQEEEIQELSATLQRFPPALQQTVAYIREENERAENQECKFTIKDYLVKYKEEGRTADLLKYEPVGGSSYGKSAFIALKITLRKIEKMNHGDEALRVLKIMAYFDPNNIPTKIFLELGTDKKRLGSVLRLIKQYALIRLDQDVANVHRLVQQVVRTELEALCKTNEVLRDAMHLLKRVMPDKTNCKYAQHAMSLWSHANKYEDVVKDFSSVPHSIMNELDNGLRYREACLFGRTACLLLEKVLGPNHVDTLLLMSNTADALARTGEYNEALEVYTVLLERNVENFGDDHFRTLTVKTSMAATLQNVGKFVDALQAFREVLARRKESLGEDHPYTLSAMNSVAVVLASMMKNSEALEIFQTVLDKRRRILGSDHLDTLTTMHDIAQIYNEQQKYDLAMRAYEEVLKKRRQMLGPEHPLTLLTVNNMTAVLYNKQKHDDALFDYRDLMEKADNVFGPNHFQTFMAKQAVALILRDQGNYEEALALCEELLDTGKECLDSDHPIILETRAIKATVLFRQRNYDEACCLYDELLKSKDHSFGPHHPETLASMEDKASVLSAQGKFDDALILYREVLQKKIHSLGPDHHDTIVTEFNLAALQGKRGNHKEAVMANQAALRKLQNNLDSNNPDILWAKQNIVISLSELGNYDEALKVCKELHDQMKQIWGPDHNLTVSAKRRLGSILYLQGQYDEALDVLQDVLERGNQILTSDHPDNFRTRNSIAAILDIKGYHHMAFQTYQEVLSKRKEVFGTDDWETLETLKDIALSLYTQGKYKESLKVSRHVLDKIKHVLGPAHPSVLLIQNNIARALKKQGKSTEAMEIYEDLLKICNELLGPDHPRTLDVANDIAELLDEEGNSDLSLETYEKVLQRRTEMFGPNHLTTLDTKNNMATVLVHQERYETALRIYYEVFDKTKELLGSDNPSTLATQNNIAAVLSLQERDEEALKIYKEILDKRRKHFGLNHPDTFSTMSNIADIQCRLNRFKSALKVYEDVLKKRSHVLGPNHPDTLNTKTAIADVHFKQGNLEMALEIYTKVLRELEEVLGSCHPSVLSTQTHVAVVQSSQGNHEKARQLYEDILSKSKQVLGISHPFTLEMMDKLATALYNCGRGEEAVKLRKEVLDKEMEHLGRNHRLTLRTTCKLVKELDELEKQEDLIDTFVYVMDKEDLLGLYNRDPLFTGNALLHKLAKEGRLEILKHLLDNGADVLDGNESDSLLTDAVVSDNKDVVKLILNKVKEKGNDIRSYINTPDEEGNTPLMWAAAAGGANAAQVLIDYGADVDAENPNHETALHWAGKAGNEGAAKLLLDNKADPSTEDANGKTALDAACEKLKNDMEILKEICNDLKTVAALLCGTTRDTPVS